MSKKVKRTSGGMVENVKVVNHDSQDSEDTHQTVSSKSTLGVSGSTYITAQQDENGILELEEVKEDEKKFIGDKNRCENGLAFSGNFVYQQVLKLIIGGGIRSATFAVGVLQHLAKAGMLEKFGYISSVSGGGFTVSSFFTHLNGMTNKPYTDIMKAQMYRMRKNIDYLTGDIISMAYFLLAVVFGVLHNVVFVLSLFFILASIIYSGYRPVTINKSGYFMPTDPNGRNCTPTVDSNSLLTCRQYAMSNLKYTYFTPLFNFMGFYDLEFYISNGNYTELSADDLWLVKAIGVLTVSFLMLGAIVVLYASLGKRSIFKKITNVLFERGEPEFWVHNWICEILKKSSHGLFFVLSCAPVITALVALCKLMIYVIGRYVTSSVISSVAVSQVVIVIGSVASLLKNQIGVISSLPLRLIVFVTMCILPLVLLSTLSMFCVWFLRQETFISQVELFSWCYCLVEALLFEHFSCALHDMYRTNIMRSFFYRGQDVDLSDLGVKNKHRFLYLANTCLNNYSAMNDKFPRTYHSFTMSQLHHGSVVTGYTRTKKVNTTTSTAMSVSGAALSINLGNIDKSYSSLFFRFTFSTLSLNLASWVQVYSVNFLSFLSTAAFALNFVISVTTFYFFLSGRYDNVLHPLLQLFILIQLLWPVVTSLIIEVVFFVYILIDNLLHNVKGKLYIDQNSWFAMIRRWPMNDLPIWRSLTQVFGVREVRSVRNVFLSDGGHFDNMGIYPLLQRRVKNILCFDGSEDKYYTLTDLYATLAMAKRDGLIKAVTGKPFDKPGHYQVDLFEPILPSAEEGRHLKITNGNHMKFKVIYSYHPYAEGTITFAKTTLMGEEGFMVKLVALGDKVFPNLTTIDQWFDVNTFDSYRLLGKFVSKCAASTFFATDEKTKTNE
ncbi:cytosolic phospholipase [Acrasis kona]|uniref:Cytosolic phospholipase n=1 Tax=Acrasis kona TaxID=1008807 RepID=A0AAW2YP67_9EUKA